MTPTNDADISTPRHTVVIVGSGFGALAAAVNLQRRGIEDFVLLERREFMGGTWKQNAYPGAAVDVPSPLYSLSFEPHAWSRMFAERDELAAYTDHVIDAHDLRRRTVLGAEVTRLEWVGDEWLVSTADKGRFRARFVVNASGPLSTPVVPPFPGRESFRGAAFHTNDWDHSVDLRGKKVAIVGSGASAAQVIPAIAPEVGALHVFQRSPHWVMPRPDRRFSVLERAALTLPGVQRALRTAIYWNLETRVVGFKYSQWALEKVAQDKALKLLAKQVPDETLRAKLTPDYTIGCKRIILSNALYPALSADNVTLHDRADGIERIDKTGIVTAGGEHLDLDVIVWSTGYDATDGVIGYPVIGRDGHKLAEFWSEFPRAYLGTSMPGFPNLFLVTGPNTGIGHTSAIFVIEAQMEYIMQAIDAARDGTAHTIEVTESAEDDYTREVHTQMERTVWKQGGCSSWYQSRDGHVIAMFPGFSFTYRRLAKAFKPGDHVIA